MGSEPIQYSSKQHFGVGLVAVIWLEPQIEYGGFLRQPRQILVDSAKPEELGLLCVLDVGLNFLCSDTDYQCSFPPEDILNKVLFQSISSFCKELWEVPAES